MLADLDRKRRRLRHLVRGRRSGRFAFALLLAEDVAARAAAGQWSTISVTRSIGNNDRPWRDGPAVPLLASRPVSGLAFRATAGRDSVAKTSWTSRALSPPQARPPTNERLSYSTWSCGSRVRTQTGATCGSPESCASSGSPSLRLGLRHRRRRACRRRRSLHEQAGHGFDAAGGAQPDDGARRPQAAGQVPCP